MKIPNDERMKKPAQVRLGPAGFFSLLPQDVVRFHAAVLVAGAHDRDTQRVGRHRDLKPGEGITGLRGTLRNESSVIQLYSGPLRGRKWRRSCAAVSRASQ